MRFRAQLRRNSTAYRLWSNRRLAFSKISDVLFRRQGKDYVTDELTSDEVFVLTNNPQILLSMVTEPVGQMLPTNLPEPESVKQEEPAKSVLEVVKNDPPKPTPSPVTAGRLADLLATPPSKRR